MKRHRVNSPAWWLAMLWVALGAAMSADAFVASAQRFDLNLSRFPAWVGEPQVINIATDVGAVMWLVLTIPVLAAGAVRLGRRETPDPVRERAWIGVWVAGVALMVLTWVFGQGTPRPTYTCSPHEGCAISAYSPAVVVWGELPLCAAFLALAALVTWVLVGGAVS